MPYRQALRFTDTGPVSQREVAEVCNGINDATRAAIEALEAANVQGVGGMDLAGLRPGLDIDGSYQDIDGFTAQPFTPVNVTFIELFGFFSFQIPGRWRGDFTFNLTFTPDPAARITNLRVLNKTTGTPKGNPIPLIIEAGDTGIAQSRFFAFELLESEVGDGFSVQIGGSSTFAGVTWFDQTLLLTYLGPSV